MSLSLQSNIASLKAQRQFSQTTGGLLKIYQSLSTGMRINSASDDAAGLAIADSLRADTRIYTQAIRNIQDGQSMISISQGAAQELSNIVTRILELAEQSANGIYGSSQRSALDKEAQALTAEYNRIVNTTQFNGQSLLNSSSSVALQVGLDSTTGSQITVNTQLVTASTGDGTFQAAIAFDLLGRPSYAMTADFNNDGNLDVGFAGQNSYFGVSLGNGDGTFKRATQYSFVANTAYYIEAKAVDLTGDGVLDVVAGADYSGKVAVLVGNADGSFKAGLTFGGSSALIAEVEVADFNGDGNLDIVSGSGAGDALVFLAGNGNGTFKYGVSQAVTIFDLASGDLNGDGRVDIVTTGTERVALSNGNGTFSIGPAFALSAARGPVLADLNNDGYLDLAAWDPSNFISYALGNGNGTFRAETTLATGSLDFWERNLSIADINGDGNQDLLIAETQGNSIGVFLGNGNGTFQARTSYATTIKPPSIAVGDFNEDGAVDIIAASDTFNSSVNILFGNASSSGNLGDVDLTTLSGARSALTNLRTAQENLSRFIGALGSTQSRLDVAASYVTAARENYSSAESQIRDVDTAQAAAELVRRQILQRAGAAILGQANQQPQIALQILQRS